MDIKDRIKQRRESLNLSIRSVALALGVAPSTVMRYETNEIQNMGIDKISELAKVLKCSPEYLMGWSSNPMPVSHSLYAGGDAPDEADEKYQEALAYVYQTIHDIRSREEADRLNRTVMLFGKLDDVDKERIIERMETMLEGEKYKK